MLAYNVCIKENPQVVHSPHSAMLAPPPPPKKKHNINNPDALLIISA